MGAYTDARLSRAMGKHDPSRKRKTFRVPKRRAKVSETPCNEQGLFSATYNYAFKDETVEVTPEVMRPVLIGTLKEMASLVWESDYRALFKLEQLALEDEKLMTGAMLLKAMPKISTYKAQGRSSKVDASKRAERDDMNAMSMAVKALRQANQQRHGFSICVESIAALARRTPTKDWRRRCRERALIDRKTATTLVHYAMAVRPPPNFLVTSAIQHFCFDQKYAKKGESRAKHRAAERVDASGDLVELVSTVLVNVMKLPVPHTLGRFMRHVPPRSHTRPTWNSHKPRRSLGLTPATPPRPSQA